VVCLAEMPCRPTEYSKLVKARGEFLSPAGKGLRGSEFPAIVRLVYGGLTPLPSGSTLSLCSLIETGRTGPAHRRRWRRRGEVIYRGHNGRSGWFWRFQPHPMRPGDNSRRWGVLGGVSQGTPEEIDKPAHAIVLATAFALGGSWAAFSSPAIC
jgi:hypothetical protein